MFASTISILFLGAFLFYPFWLCFMLVMGLIMSGLTRGDRSLEWMEEDIRASVQGGAVSRTQSERLIANVYIALIMLGILFFYMAIPVLLLIPVLLGLATLGAIFSGFGGSTGSIGLLIITGTMFWSVVRGLFAFGSGGPPGIPIKRKHEPKLYRMTDAVAARVDTDPINRIYLAPGSEICVFQTGRGPFGILGLKHRALVLGMCSLHTLTVLEFQSILAHEYAHFGHGDTKISRLIHQVMLTMAQTLDTMAQTGGWLRLLNPVYWFLILYFKAFELMTAGYSRSQEYLADRMAIAVYGSNTFKKALVKVATEAIVMEECLMSREFDAVAEMDFKKTNAYEENRHFMSKVLDKQKTKKLYRQLVSERGSIFSTHPTVRERVDAIKGVNDVVDRKRNPAVALLRNVKATEIALSKYLRKHFRRLVKSLIDYYEANQY
ncbi:M48 family peptidase [Polystyrenella longa]|uniref:M48 family peptidase n=1 Tax=Polystyrenella longa TaxID=2528007 RepID=A0A518CH08_9PLAN|nr:M48 family metallopeptidase [Polystyrenella longa]QDU78516.1 M48 family peptidase [Polystyrenella longa]